MSGGKKKIICFTDSRNKPLFYLPDGENIIVTRFDGQRFVHPCNFLDELHFMAGRMVYNIHKFAQKMERAGNTYAPEHPPELPALCASVLPDTGELIIIEKGKKGYQTAGFSTSDPQRNRCEANRFNAYKKVTPQAEAAMLGGALRGWASPAARVTSYDFLGKPFKPPRAKSLKPKEAER